MKFTILNKYIENANRERSKPEWKKQNLSNDAIDLLKRDASVFIGSNRKANLLNVLESSKGATITDTEGRSYFDFHSNSIHLAGYGNHDMMETIKLRLSTLPFASNNYTNTLIINCAETLLSYAHENLSKVMFTTSENDSLCAALNLVRNYTKKEKVLLLWNDNAETANPSIPFGDSSMQRKTFISSIVPTIPVPPPSSYNGMWCDNEMNNNYSRILEYLKYTLERNNDIGALLAEPIRSSGVHIPKDFFWKEVRNLCNQYNIQLIFDESHTALYRTGRMFAHENFDIVPDICILGKELGGGIIPFSCILTSAKFRNVESSIYNEKNPLGATCCLSLLRYFDRENIEAHVNEIEMIFRGRLMRMKKNCHAIGDVRGIGMMWGLEMVKDKNSKLKAVEASENILYQCLENGLSFNVFDGNIIQLTPALSISHGELHHALDILEEALSKI